MPTTTRRLPQPCPLHSDHPVVTTTTTEPGNHRFPTLTQHRCATDTRCNTPLGWEFRIPKIRPFTKEPKLFVHGPGECIDLEVHKAMKSYQYRSFTTTIAFTGAILAIFTFAAALSLHDQQPTQTIAAVGALLTAGATVVATASFTYRRFRNRPPAPDFSEHAGHLCKAN